ncbi:MAG: TadE/TadG family type IV pilus assembly protein [Planctomycetota bacterium]|jgi:hypothetical protein
MKLLKKALKMLEHPTVCGALLITIGSMISAAVIYPQEILDAFAISENQGFMPLIIVTVISAGACFMTAGWWILSWIFRQLKGFRKLSTSSRATVATEFLLVLPVLMYLFTTVFQMGEIAHAQLLFRYAAFSSARAGSASEKLLPWLPKIKMQTNSFGKKELMIYFISAEDKARMRAAAVVALSGIDANKFTKKTDGMDKFSHKDLAYYYHRAGKACLVRRNDKNPWVNSTDFFGRQVRDANASLVSFEPQCEYSRLFPSDLSSMITNQISQILNLQKIVGGNSPIGKVLSMVGINPQDMIMDVMNSLVSKILKGTGLDKILRQLPNPLSPPMISVEMEYEMRMRPASLFGMLCPKRKNGYACLRLRRTGNYKTMDPLLMQTTGGRIDMPVVPPIIAYVNLFPGDCKISTKKPKESEGKKKPAKKKKKK